MFMEFAKNAVAPNKRKGKLVREISPLEMGFKSQRPHTNHFAK